MADDRPFTCHLGHTPHFLILASKGGGGGRAIYHLWWLQQHGVLPLYCSLEQGRATRMQTNSRHNTLTKHHHTTKTCFHLHSNLSLMPEQQNVNFQKPFVQMDQFPSTHSLYESRITKPICPTSTTLSPCLTAGRSNTPSVGWSSLLIASRVAKQFYLLSML